MFQLSWVTKLFFWWLAQQAPGQPLPCLADGGNSCQAKCHAVLWSRQLWSTGDHPAAEFIHHLAHRWWRSPSLDSAAPHTHSHRQVMFGFRLLH